jgi:integrase
MRHMIKTMFSRRHRQKVYRLDATVNGKRFRRFFLKKSEAEAVAYKIKHDAIARRYGLPVAAERPFLSDLIVKRLTAIANPNERTRATRVLNGLADVLPAGICVDEVTKAGIQLYVEKRQRDGVKAQSIDRELNIIAATLNSVDFYYPQLEQWRPPRMPRPKVFGGRRERIWSQHEIKAVLGELYAGRRNDEQEQSVIGRVRVGRRVQFCLLNGVRTGEMAKIRKRDIDWQARKVRIEQGKTGNVKTIGPLGPASIEILKEFCDQSENEFVFFRGKNITPKFYKILARACHRAGVLYGKNTPGGLVLYDSRHTATTHLLETGVSPATVKEWMGWSDSAFVLYYSHATEKSMEKAGRSLERLAGKKIA